MNVRELKELLNATPEGISLEDYNEMPVMITTDGFNHDVTDKEESGMVTISNQCDKQGNVIDEAAPADMKFFIIYPCGLMQSLKETGQIKVED